jgi:UDP-glucose 4-epimerase
MRVVVTGASGFLGARLASHLRAAAGDDVVALVRTSPDGIAPAGTVAADASDWGWTKALPRSADCVIHLAQSRRYREFPEGAPDMVRVNVDATTELLDWARGAGVKRFILASTGSVYAPSLDPLREESVIVPTTLYATTKYCAELIASSYAGLFHVIILRLFTLYGPGQRTGAFKTILDRIRSGAAVTLAGENGMKMTPLYVDDAARIIAELVHRAAPPPAERTILNVAGSELTNVRSIAAAMATVGGWSLRFDTSGACTSNMIADTSAIRRRNLIPRMPLSEGIAATVHGAMF